jgi:hypothetical protein
MSGAQSVLPGGRGPGGNRADRRVRDRRDAVAITGSDDRQRGAAAHAGGGDPDRAGGVLSARFGRKPLFIGCAVGFTIASMGYGAAQSLAQIVGFRSLQGMFSTAQVPLSQATLLDIYPVERRGFAMAILGHWG